MKKIGRLLIVLLLVCTALLLTAAADEGGTSGDGTALTSEPEAPMPPEEDLDSMNRPANLIQEPGIGSTLSQGSWWIIGAGAVVIVGGVAAIVIVNRKKKKSAAKAEAAEVQ